MKVTSKDGRTWFQKNEDGSTSIGFTKEFLSGLECCWHMVASSTRLEIKEDQPMLSVETNDGLFSVNAPVSGVISYFDNKALNFPDKLDDETVVALMKPQKEETVVDEWAEIPVANPFARPIDWDQVVNDIAPIGAAHRRLNIPRGGF